MNIGTSVTTSTSTIIPDVLQPRRAPRAPSGLAGDNVHTSQRALLYSRSQAALSKQLLPREEMVQRFKETIDAPLDLDDAALDRLFGNM